MALANQPQPELRSGSPADRVVREIVLALAPDDDGNNAAIPLALALADQFTANLLGLLVEDEALLRAAALPFAFEISRHGEEERRLNPGLLERQFRRAAQQLHEALQPHARAGGFTATVRSVRGHPSSVLAAHGGSADIVIVGRGRESRWPAADATPVRLDVPMANPARVDAAVRALQTCTRPATWQRMPWTGGTAAVARLRARRPSLVLTSAPAHADGDGDADGERLEQLIEALECPIVVLR